MPEPRRDGRSGRGPRPVAAGVGVGVDPPSTGDSIVIRAAVEADVPELSALAERVWSDSFSGGLDAADVTEHMRKTRSPGYFSQVLRERPVLVAESDGALVGYAQFGPVSIPEVHPEARDRSLNRLYVDTALHGRGIGRRLLTAALEHPELATAPRVYLQVWEDNGAAVALYESVGFQVVGTTHFTIGSASAQDLVMRLDRR